MSNSLSPPVPAKPISAILRLIVVAGILAIGCDSKSPEEQVKATERVLKELGVGDPSPSSSTKNLAAAAAPTDSTQSNPSQTSVSAPVSEPKPKTSSGNAADADFVGDSINSIAANPALSQGSAAPTSQEPALAPPRPVVKPTFTVDDPSAPWTGADQLPRETWEVQYLGNTPIGYIHRKIEVSRSQGNKVFRVEADSRTRVSLNGKSMNQILQVWSIEHDNGELISMEGSLEVGDNKQSFKGILLQNQLRLTNIKNGQQIATNIEWKKNFRGPFAVEQSMYRKPLKQKESRKLTYFDPILSKMVDGVLEADEYLITPTMMGGSRELLQIRSIATVGESGTQALIWVDKLGESFKSYMPGADIRSFKTEPLAAQIISSVFDVRSIETRQVPLEGDVKRLVPLDKSDKFITYRISHRSRDPFGVFSDRGNQRLKSVDAKTIELTVFQASEFPEPIASIAQETKPDPSCLASTDYIPARDTRIQQMAKALAVSDRSVPEPELTTARKVAACQKGIFQRITLKPFDDSIQQIPKILKAKSGNAFEHAMMFASICRALNLPTRVAIGLKFNGSLETPAMGLHAWIEYYDDGRWVPADSSEANFPAPIDRIKISESSFSDGNPYDDLVGAVRMIPELEIKVVPR